ncbi:MAG: hypothetical protein IJM15_06330 [Erysipelotrichaceae bacterium]|nr:hypothetical protein [Erysipelotrichaceae bacterium]
MSFWDRFRLKPKPELEIMNGEFVEEVIDEKAPEVIVSKNMILFELHCNFEMYLDEARYRRFDVFASRCDRGTYIYFNNKLAEEKYEMKCFVTDFGIFEKLQEVIEKYCLYEGNGLRRFEYGLPDDFGGALLVRYDSGEYITKADNHYAIIPAVAGDEIMDLFLKSGEAYYRQADFSDELREVEFSQNNDSGFFRHYRLTDENGIWILRGEKFNIDQPEEVMVDQVRVDESVPFRISERFSEYCLYALGGFSDKEDLPKDYPVTTVVFRMRSNDTYRLKNTIYAPLFVLGYTYEIQSFFEKEFNRRPENPLEGPDIRETEDEGDII